MFFRRKLLIPVAVFLLLLAVAANIPCFTAYQGDNLLFAYPAIEKNMPFKIRFIHSVQKTPVEEFLQLDDQRNGFILTSTRYQSFGVGLPFLDGEGSFREEGDYFIFDNMNRHFPQLSLRTGVGTQLTLTVQGEEYRFYEMMPLGSRIDLAIIPAYRLIPGLH